MSEFVIHEPALVVPCGLHAALAWSYGCLEDTDLILWCPKLQFPQAFLIASLPNIKAFRNCLVQMASLCRIGAMAVICRTNTPVVVKHLNRIGFKLTYQEPTKARYLLIGEGMARFARTVNNCCRHPV